MPRSAFRNVLIIKRAAIRDASDTLARIDEARAEHGLSIGSICKAAGVSLTAYYQWRSGRGIMPETEAAVRAAIRRLVKRPRSKSEVPK